MRGLLIGGSSHCGKSTLAQRVGDALGWRVNATDKLGRHPGRPWLGVPPQVEEFYEALTDDTIYWFLRVHHANFWPLLTSTIADEKAANGGFVLEGSALRPDSLATLDDPELLPICLYAEPEFLAERMRAESNYVQRDARQKRLIDKFITRSLRDNRELYDAAMAHGIEAIDVADASDLERSTEQLLQKLQH
jgi:2-phosphoglycerate kinase